jgi:predicted nucleic acid-binding Zn finger protein
MQRRVCVYFMIFGLHAASRLHSLSACWVGPALSLSAFIRSHNGALFFICLGQGVNQLSKCSHSAATSLKSPWFGVCLDSEFTSPAPGNQIKRCCLYSARDFPTPPYSTGRPKSDALIAAHKLDHAKCFSSLRPSSSLCLYVCVTSALAAFITSPLRLYCTCAYLLRSIYAINLLRNSSQADCMHICAMKCCHGRFDDIQLKYKPTFQIARILRYL